MLDCIQSANRQILPYVVTVPLLLDQVIVTLLNPATDSRCVLFPPSDSRRIKVITVVPRGSGVAETTLRELLAPSRGGVGNFAVGDFRFKDTPIAFGFYLDPPNEDYRNQNPHKTTFRVCQGVAESGKPDFDGNKNPEYTQNSELMQ